MKHSDALDQLATALANAQGEFESVSKDSANPCEIPRDQYRNPLSPCPDCGQLKIRRSKRCKPCASQAQKGIPKTDDPKEGASHYRARQLCPPSTCTYDGCADDGSHVHHIDGDPFNNDLGNLTRLCPRHHMIVDGRLEAARARAVRVGRLYGGRKSKNPQARLDV